MSYADRQEKGTLLTRKLAEAVAIITPEGIGRWDRCWEVVDAPGGEFMTALSSWERDPSDVTMQRVSDAYDAVMEAWHVAVAEYTTEGAA
jgi:hypothetical protein